MSTTDPVYDMSLLDKVTGNITLTKIRLATNQIASALTLHHCDIDESKDYGHAWIILEDAVWLTKNRVTVAVPIPTKPNAFDGTTSAAKFIYKAALKNYTNYKLHSIGAIKMLKYIFDESCFLDLEDDQGQMIGYTPHEVITHIFDTNVSPEDHDREIVSIEKDVRQEYDPSEPPQVYFKKLQTCQLLLVQLQLACPEKTLIQQAMEQFERQMDLKEAVDKWVDKDAVDKTWANFKIFFSKEIKKNKFRQGSFKSVGLANAAQQQRLDTTCENQQVLAATSIEHHNVIDSLLARIDRMESAAVTQPPAPAPTPAPAQANAATTTDLNAKMMEMMMKMMGKMTTGGNARGKGTDIFCTYSSYHFC
jgi:hypothetical protein